MRRSVRAIAALTAAIALGIGVLLVPSRATTAAVARTPDCPAPPITVEKLWRVVDEGNQLACFGGRLLTFRTFVRLPPDGIGWEDAWSLEPAWLDDNSGSIWMLYETPGHLVTAWVPPALGRCDGIGRDPSCPFRWLVGRWATVRAHFDGPVARTCRFVEHPPGPGFTTRDAVASCRAKLIVLSIGPVAPPATATVATPTPAGDRTTPALLAAVAAILVSLLLSQAPGRAPRAASGPGGRRAGGGRRG